MRCPRICCAYTYRLSRRHSTICLIAVFIISLTIILHLYSHRHRRNYYQEHLIGDFDYRPGAFLKDTYPNESINFCRFNYGLPEYLNWSSFRVHPSPELGIHSPYRVIYNAIETIAYQNVSKFKAVTYVTQATPEFLYNIVEIARYWDGPISLSLYVPDYDLAIAMQILDHLCHCYHGMSKVSVHFFYPKSYPPNLNKDIFPTTTEVTTTVNVSVEEVFKKKLENYRNLSGKARAEYVQKSIQNKIKSMMVKKPLQRTSAPHLIFNDCSGLDYFDIPTFRREHNMFYPINVGRNSARNGTRTNYFLVSDIELVPSDRLASKFLHLLRRLIGPKNRDEGCIISKTVFVVPLFELSPGVNMPRDKTTLVELIEDNRATYFHQKICSHCQKFPGLQTWLKRSEPDGVEPMMITKREYPYHRWEPVYFGTNKDPWYSENLFWEGQQDKMTQMLELCLQNYRTVILDGAFLCHAAVHSTKKRNSSLQATRINDQKYLKIIENFSKKYQEKYRCVPHYGLLKGEKTKQVPFL